LAIVRRWTTLHGGFSTADKHLSLSPHSVGAFGMAETLDLTILDASPHPEALAFCRCSSDIAVARLPLGKELQ
jgi:hypothetical protein